MNTSRYFSDKIILTCAICVVCSFLGQIFEVTPIVNMIYAFSLVLVFFCYFASGFVSQTMLVFIGLIAISSVAHGVIFDDIDFFTHILISISTYICIEVGVNAKIDLSTYKKIAYLFLLVGIITEVAYYLGPLKNSYFLHTDSICLNLHNPNATGMWLTCIFILLVYSFFLFTGLSKVFFLAVAIGLMPIIVATKARNSLLACLVFIFCVVMARIFKIKKIPNWMLLVIVTLPIIVFYFYMFVIVKNMDFWQEIFRMDGIDKGIGTRNSIWQRVLNDFWHCFLVGDYKFYYNSQMHNSMLTIYCRFGALSTITVCVLLYKALKRLQENSSFYAVISLAAILFTGCFEASVFVGVAGLYLMLLIIPAGAAAEYNYKSKMELLELDRSLFERTLQL